MKKSCFCLRVRVRVRVRISLGKTKHEANGRGNNGLRPLQAPWLPPTLVDQGNPGDPSLLYLIVVCSFIWLTV